MRAIFNLRAPLSLFTSLQPYDDPVRFFLKYLFPISLCVAAQLKADPELVADGAISYEDGSKIVVAEKAELRDDNLLLRADEIRFNRATRQAKASGNVQLTFRELRLLADTLSYNITDNSFEATNFRAGLPPIIIDGDTIEGSPELVTIDRGDFYYGEPGAFTPKLSASSVEILPNDAFRARRARLAMGSVPLLSLPRYSNDFRGQKPEIDGKLGYRSYLGAYAQSEILLPINERLMVGGNLDLYTERGILIGPAAHYQGFLGDAYFDTTLSSGWINDQGDIELSELYPGELPQASANADRGFILLNNRTALGDDFELVASVNYLDDSDVLRDFRRDMFRDTQDPDSYVSLAWVLDPVYLSLLVRPRINNFQSVVERLPELRADLPWTQFFETDAYQSGHFSAARLRWNPDALGGSPSALDPWLPAADNTLWEQTRIDLAYGLQYPVVVTDGITVTPLASVRGLSYETQRFDNIDEARQDLGLAEVGVDLRATFIGDFALENEFWNIKGFRHLFQPVASYRYRAGDALSEADVYPIDRLYGSVHVPSLDLLDSRATDTLEPVHQVRLGIENTLLTQSDPTGTRSLASFNTYYDAVFDNETLAPEDAIYTELTISPASWLDMDFFTRWDAEDTALDAFSTRITLKSGDLWRLSFYSAFLDDYSDIEGDIEQFGVLFRYQFSQRFGFGARLRYDNTYGSLTEQSYTVAQRLGRNFEFEYGVKISRGSDREDDFGVALRLRLVNF